MSDTQPAHRLRVTFAKEGPLRFVAHLDMMRTWERTIRRARLPLVYTQGFSPHARIALAAPLPVGVVGRRELLDLWLGAPLPPEEVAERLGAAMPPGLRVEAIEVVDDALPSLQSALHSATYEVAFDSGAVEVAAVRAASEQLLATESVPWEEQRGDKTRRYDLRETVLAIEVRETDGRVVVAMHLSLEQGRTGRPQQVLAAMGVETEPTEVARTAVRLAEPGVVA
ncbi:MAG: DUF2344 domain-containing protein [Dehalococcoidia bacterium]|nr:DUF2344 domain-containing protein [Dehalococcoidia bacterium]